MPSSKKSAAKTGKTQTAVTGRFIGDHGRRANVERRKPSSVTIKNRASK